MFFQVGGRGLTGDLKKHVGTERCISKCIFPVSPGPPLSPSSEVQELRIISPEVIHDGGERCRIKKIRSVADGKSYVAKVQNYVHSYSVLESKIHIDSNFWLASEGKIAA